MMGRVHQSWRGPGDGRQARRKRICPPPSQVRPCLQGRGLERPRASESGPARGLGPHRHIAQQHGLTRLKRWRPRPSRSRRPSAAEESPITFGVRKALRHANCPITVGVRSALRRERVRTSDIKVFIIYMRECVTLSLGKKLALIFFLENLSRGGCWDCNCQITVGVR